MRRIQWGFMPLRSTDPGFLLILGYCAWYYSKLASTPQYAKAQPYEQPAMGCEYTLFTLNDVLHTVRMCIFDLVRD